MTAATTVTRRVEFDMGHRLQHHDGKCRNIHGHRYAIEVTVMGFVDFGLLDAAIGEVVGDWDHALMLERTDPLCASLHGAGVKIIYTEGPPTAEHMADAVGIRLSRILAAGGRHDLTVTRVRVYETTKAWADWGVSW